MKKEEEEEEGAAAWRSTPLLLLLSSWDQLSFHLIGTGKPPSVIRLHVDRRNENKNA